jgi:hypothetical protein
MKGTGMSALRPPPNGNLQAQTAPAAPTGAAGNESLNR